MIAGDGEEIEPQSLKVGGGQQVADEKVAVAHHPGTKLGRVVEEGSRVEKGRHGLRSSGIEGVTLTMRISGLLYIMVFREAAKAIKYNSSSGRYGERRYSPGL